MFDSENAFNRIEADTIIDSYLEGYCSLEFTLASLKDLGFSKKEAKDMIKDKKEEMFLDEED